MNALDGNFFATIGRIDQDLEAADHHLTRHQKEIKECMADIDLLRAPTINVLSWIEYLEEMNAEREARLNQLEEADTKRERRMQELEELLATMKSCRCQEVPHPRSRENPIEVSNLEYAEEYLTPPVAPDLESEEGEVSSDGSIEERVPDAVIILRPFTPEESVHLSRGSSVVEPVCTCGPEIPLQIASDSKGSTLIENEEPIPTPGPVTTGQHAVRSGPRNSSPERHTHIIYHPYRRCFGSNPLGRRRKTPRPGLEDRSGKAMARGVSLPL